MRVDRSDRLQVVCLADQLDLELAARPSQPAQRHEKIGHHIGLAM
jgi:hypothetical protein